MDSADVPVPECRASNRGCLEISFAEYLQLLDWTGRELRSGKRGAIPADVAPLLTRLHVSEESWLKLVTGFSRIFRLAAGTPLSLQRDAEKHGKRRREGIAQSTALFA